MTAPADGPDAPQTSVSEPAASKPPLEGTFAPNWQRTLFVMMGIQLGMNMGFTVLSPVMPLFLPELGVSKPGEIELWAGVLAAVTPLVAAFASPLWGRVADRRGRKLMVLRSCFAIALFIGLMSLVGNVWQFVGLRALMGAFAGFNAATISLVASQVPPGRLGYSLGWLSTGQLVGTLIGPLLGGFVADVTGSYRAPFVVTSVVCGLCGVLAFVLVKERFAPPTAGTAKATLFQSFAILSHSPGLLPLFVVLLLAQFGVQAVQPVVTLYVEQLLGPVPALATLGGLAFSVTGIADLIASPFLGRRSDVLGYRRVLLISLAGAALASAPQAFVPGIGASSRHVLGWACSWAASCPRPTRWSDDWRRQGTAARFTASPRPRCSWASRWARSQAAPSRLRWGCTGCSWSRPSC